jgi:hypothetical protein
MIPPMEEAADFTSMAFFVIRGLNAKFFVLDNGIVA